MKNKTPINIRLKPDLLAAADRRAQIEHRTRTGIIEAALRLYVERGEKLDRLAIEAGLS